MPEQGEARADAAMVQLKLRFQERIRAQLEVAAKANGTSLNSEIVARLERTLEDDARAGGHDTSRFLIALASQIAIAERNTGKAWQDDAETYWLARLLMLRAISAHDPVTDVNSAYAALKAKLDDARKRRDLLDEVLTECHAIGRNALLMLAKGRENADYAETDERFWINPTTPDQPMTTEDRATVRELLAELHSLREQVDALQIEIAEVRAPIQDAKERAIAAFERLTAPDEV